MSVLLEIAERVERYDPKLSPDNRADELPLDLAIHKAVGLAGEDWQVARGSVTGYFSGDGKGGFGNPTVPRYSRSLDAARTLVAAEGSWGFLLFLGSKPKAFVDVTVAEAATPALALCAAALRARAAQGGEA